MNGPPGIDPSEHPLMLDLMEALTSSLEMSEVLSRAHGVLRRMIPADHAALCVSKPGRPTEYDWAVAQMPPAFFAHYPEMVAEDFVRDAVVRRPNVVLRDSEMVPREALERSTWYRRCRELGMPLEHVMGVLLDVRHDWHGGFTLYRDRRRAFSKRDQGLLQRLTPVLAGTVRNCRILQEAVGQRRLLEALYHSQGAESVVVAPPSTEVMRTAQATALLESWFTPLERNAQGLPAVLVERLTWLSQAEGMPSSVEASTWEREGPTRTLRVTLMPLPEQAGRRLWAMVLQELAHEGQVPPAWRERLTEREVEVVGCALRGWDTRLIAAHLGCTPGTVKKHFQRIFDKLGVDSRAMLLSRAAQP